MKLVNEQPLLKSFLFVLALSAIINTQAMEKQEEDYQLASLSMGQTIDIGELTDVVENLHEAHKAQNRELFANIFQHFTEDLNQKDPVEQLATWVEATKIAAKKSKPLTLAFCDNLLNICNAYPDLSEITPEIVRPLIPNLHKNKHPEAIKKIICIFANNADSEEYHAMQSSIQHGLNTSTTPSIDNDEAIARAYQQGSQHISNTEYDLALAKALAASMQINDNKNAGTLQPSPHYPTGYNEDWALAQALSESVKEVKSEKRAFLDQLTDEDLIQESERLNTSTDNYLQTCQLHFIQIWIN